MKIHLGCGRRRLPGYTHIDPDENVNPDYIGSAEKIPVMNNIATMLYFAHGLEHVRKADVEHVIGEFSRVLRPGGTLRLSVPDFGIIAYLYSFENVSLARLGCINGGQRTRNDVHYNVFDYETLATLLTPHFYNIREWDPYKAHPVGFDDFSFAKINERLISLNVEATAK